LKRLVLFALLILTVTFSSYSGLLSSLKANAAAPISNPLLQQQPQPRLQLPAITSLPRSPSLTPNTALASHLPQRTAIFISALDGNNSPLQNGGATSSNSITFTFAFEGAAGTIDNNPPGVTSGGTTTTGIAGFQCTLDNSPSASSCTSPVTIHNLAAGNHKLQVRAIDSAGNKEPTGASFSWTVVPVAGVGGSGLQTQQLTNGPVITPRAVPPNVSPLVPQLQQRATIITTAVDGNNSPVQNGGATSSNTITFTFTFGGTPGAPSAATGIAGFQCSLDNAPPSSCTSPATIHNLAAGNHILQVRAIDSAGDRETIPAGFSWTVLASSSSSPTSSTSEQQGGIPTPNLTSPAINNNITTGKATTTPLIPPFTATAPSRGGDGGSTPTASNNNITKANVTSTTTATKSNLSPKPGSKVVSGWSGYQLVPSTPQSCVIGNPATGLTYLTANFGDFREQVFVVECNHGLYYNTQASNLVDWTGFIGLGGYVISNPVVGLNYPTPSSGDVPHTEVFVVGSNHAMYYNREVSFSSGIWSGFKTLGGYIIGDPAVSTTLDSAGNAHTELVVVGGDHALYLNRQDSSGAWSGFARLGGFANGTPTLIRTGDGRLQIFFVTGIDHSLQTTAETAPGSGMYSGFVRLGGYIVGKPAVGMNSKGLLDLFVIGSNQGIYYMTETTSPGVGTWGGFRNLECCDDESVVATADNLGNFNDGHNQVNIFVVIFYTTQTKSVEQFTFGTGSGFGDLNLVKESFVGGYVIGDPGIGRFFTRTPGSGVFELFVVGTNHALYYNKNPTFFG
jgi:hypothetical protein